MDQNQISIKTYNQIAEKYTKRYFDDITLESPYLERFMLSLPQKAKVLDVGCGPGTFSKYLFEKGLKVQGIDLSSAMLRIAKKKIPQITFHLMDMRKLCFKRESFDGMLAAYSLIHIPSEDIPKTMLGFYKILRPGGVILIIAQKGEPDRIVEEPLKESEKIFINFFSQKRLSDYILNAGFQIVLIKEQSIQDSGSLSDKVIFVISIKPEKNTD